MNTTQKTTWTPEEIESKVAQIIAEQLDVDRQKVKREAALFVDLPMDSLDAIEVSMNCEEAFDIDVPEDASFRTVGDIIDYIVAETSSRPTQG